MKLIERILDKDNVRIALEKVIANKGAAGIDGMKVEELRGYMNANWPGIKQSILERSYRPAPVRRVEIPKPNGGVRKLGIDKDLAKQTSYRGDRYEWVVRRTCVAWAISKEKLTRRGLVSCLDYYLIRHALKTN